MSFESLHPNCNLWGLVQAHVCQLYLFAHCVYHMHMLADVMLLGLQSRNSWLPFLELGCMQAFGCEMVKICLH